MIEITERAGRMVIMKKRILSMMLAAVMCLTSTITIFAAEENRPYLALGADLSEEQKNTVLSLMDIDTANKDNVGPSIDIDY